MNRFSKISILFVFILSALSLSAQDKRNMFNPVNYSVTSQMIAPDARAAGLGDVGAATDPDVVSQFWNPAKYPFTISRAGVALNYTPWLRQLVNDIDLAYLAGYYRIGDYSAISGSFRYFSLGEVNLFWNCAVKPLQTADHPNRSVSAGSRRHHKGSLCPHQNRF